MKKYFAITAICVLCSIGIFTAGCTGQEQMTRENNTTTPTPSGTAVQTGHFVFTGEENNATVPVARGNTVTLKLPENPTTGYQWNLTTTPGLNVTSDLYVPSDTTGNLVGSGGTHIWEITVTSAGQQEISAIYKRSWEATTGNETTFRITLIAR